MDWLNKSFSPISTQHCMKSVRIWSYSGPYFPAFGLNTERYGVSFRIQSKCEKIRTLYAVQFSFTDHIAYIVTWKFVLFACFTNYQCIRKAQCIILIINLSIYAMNKANNADFK